jgi:hypothetical protein
LENIFSEFQKKTTNVTPVISEKQRPNFNTKFRKYLIFCMNMRKKLLTFKQGETDRADNLDPGVTKSHQHQSNRPQVAELRSIKPVFLNRLEIGRTYGKINVSSKCLL